MTAATTTTATLRSALYRAIAGGSASEVAAATSSYLLSARAGISPSAIYDPRREDQDEDETDTDAPVRRHYRARDWRRWSRALAIAADLSALRSRTGAYAIADRVDPRVRGMLLRALAIRGSAERAPGPAVVVATTAAERTAAHARTHTAPLTHAVHVRAPGSAGDGAPVPMRRAQRRVQRLVQRARDADVLLGEIIRLRAAVRTGDASAADAADLAAWEQVTPRWLQWYATQIARGRPTVHNGRRNRLTPVPVLRTEVDDRDRDDRVDAYARGVRDTLRAADADADPIAVREAREARRCADYRPPVGGSRPTQIDHSYRVWLSESRTRTARAVVVPPSGADDPPGSSSEDMRPSQAHVRCRRRLRRRTRLRVRARARRR